MWSWDVCLPKPPLCVREPCFPHKLLAAMCNLLCRKFPLFQYIMMTLSKGRSQLLLIKNLGTNWIIMCLCPVGERESWLSITGIIATQGHTVLPRQPHCLYKLKASVNIITHAMLQLPLRQLLRSLYRVWMTMDYGNDHAILTCPAGTEPQLLQSKGCFQMISFGVQLETGVILCQVRQPCTQT